MEIYRRGFRDGQASVLDGLVERGILYPTPEQRSPEGKRRRALRKGINDGGELMNDFTKAELQELKRCLSWVINCKDTHYTDITYFLEPKLQSMIDDYCEHEWTYDSSACAQVCRDCERIV